MSPSQLQCVQKVCTHLLFEVDATRPIRTVVIRALQRKLQLDILISL